MNERTNGTAAAPPANALGEAIQRHAAALLKASTNAQGMMAINPAQLYCDVELANLRIEILFEALVQAGVIQPGDLVQKLTAKLHFEAGQLEAQDGPQIQLATGSIPRNG